jgi:hypothetical protein
MKEGRRYWSPERERWAGEWCCVSGVDGGHGGVLCLLGTSSFVRVGSFGVRALGSRSLRFRSGSYLRGSWARSSLCLESTSTFVPVESLG